MPPISKDCSNTFLERSFMYAALCEWNKLSEHTIKFRLFQEVLKQCYLHKIMKPTEKNYVYIIVISVAITMNYCKCILLNYLRNSYLYIHWILDFK